MPTFEARRTLAVLGMIAALAGCGRGQAAGAAVSCARGDAPFADGCTVETVATARGSVLTLRNPDGGFHRLLATRDGRGLVAADGAVPARVTVTGPSWIEVAIEGDRYRLPATVR